MSTHARHPYVGELVYTAFSGSHQDAINKAMAYRKNKDDIFWEVPYLPIDPEDVGRTYESIIRINSQSGKGGVAFILEKNFGYSLPKAMHPEIGKLVQALSDTKGQELCANEILGVFKDNYLDIKEHISLVDFTLTSIKGVSKCSLTYIYKGKEIVSNGKGNGPVDRSEERRVGKECRL